MEIDARIVFQNHTPATSGTANGMIPGILVCDMRTMGDVLAELAGDATPDMLHFDVNREVLRIEHYAMDEYVLSLPVAA